MSKGKLLALTVVWLAIFGAGAIAWKVFVVPARESSELERQQATIEQTSASSRYRHTIRVGLDSFSGYALLRHASLQQQLSDKRIKWQWVDDQADYTARLDQLAKGQLQMAAFTIDALIKASAERQQLPAVIVALVDETRGADAMVGYRATLPGPDDLNRPEVRFVVTPNSPSETLARVVMSNFNLDNLAAEPFVFATDAQDVYRRYQQAKPETHEVFVVWEPYVSQMLENPAVHVIVDSGSFRGYIVDVLVAGRDFLAKHPDVVREVLEAYNRTAYQQRQQLIELVRQDASQLDSPLTEQQAGRLVEGIWWKNTQDNFAHFGLLDDSQGLQHVEDMIVNITGVLTRTGAIAADPTKGEPNLLYYDRVLRQMLEDDYHPGLESEQITSEKLELPALTDLEWEGLTPWGKLRVPQLVFARGTPRLTQRSESVLDELVETLATWPRHYVLIRGNASRLGTDLDANRRLALQRAEAAADYLLTSGVSPHRIRAVAGELQGEASVDFVLGLPDY